MLLLKLMMRFMSQVLTKVVAVSFVFCFVKEGRVVEKDRKKRINFLVNPYCSLLFSRKEIIKFFSCLSIAIAWSVELWSWEDIGLEILLILQWIFACLSKTAIKKPKQNVKFDQAFFTSHLAALRPTLGHWQGSVGFEPKTFGFRM